jgi:hypothetical protein
MEHLDVKVYSDHFASIKDFSKDLNISDIQWNGLFELLSKLFDNVYFKGSRVWVKTSEFDQTLNYLSEQMLIREKNNWEVLFRLKNSPIQFNRRLVAQMWEWYEYPCFIFLGDRASEDLLIKSYENNKLTNDIVENLEDVLVLYRSFEQNVLWIKSSFDIKKILNSIIIK